MYIIAYMIDKDLMCGGRIKRHGLPFEKCLRKSEDGTWSDLGGFPSVPDMDFSLGISGRMSATHPEWGTLWARNGYNGPVDRVIQILRIWGKLEIPSPQLARPIIYLVLQTAP